MKNTDREKPVVVEALFHAPVTRVWEAITKLEKMKQWFFDNIPSFEPVVGFRTQFVVSSGTRNFTHLWKIIDVNPGSSITYQWSYEEYKGEGRVHFYLEKQGEKTLLRLTNEGLETFPENIPEFQRESCMAGWDYFIMGNLKRFIDEGE